MTKTERIKDFLKFTWQQMKTEKHWKALFYMLFFNAAGYALNPHHALIPVGGSEIPWLIS